MFGPFQYNKWSECEVWDDNVRFAFGDVIMIDVLGGTDAWYPRDRAANLRLCERERSRIEAACRKARTREPGATDIGLTKADFFQIAGAGSGDVRLMITFPDSKTAQQFGGWVYSAGYPERIISQNTVTVNALSRDRDRIRQEAVGRNGRVADSGR
jgi:hypothetical protein